MLTVLNNVSTAKYFGKIPFLDKSEWSPLSSELVGIYLPKVNNKTIKTLKQSVKHVQS